MIFRVALCAVPLQTPMAALYVQRGHALVFSVTRLALAVLIVLILDVSVNSCDPDHSTLLVRSLGYVEIGG